MEQGTANGAETTEAFSERMLMVVTLKSGVQIRMELDSYTVQRTRSGVLVGLKWSGADRSAATIEHLDMGEVAAVHSEWPDREGAPGE